MAMYTIRVLAAALALHCTGAIQLDEMDFGVGKNVKNDQYGLQCMPYTARNVHKYVTAIVTSSIRTEDATGDSLQALKETVTSIHKTLGLKKAQLVVAFDGLKESELNNATGKAYIHKVGAFADWNQKEFGGAAFLYVNKEWSHRTELLHRVFDFLVHEGKLTPLVYVAPDNGPVSGAVDVPLIFNALACDPKVDFVRFLWSQDCREGKSVGWNAPCEAHPSYNLLQSGNRMSGRPHFATTSFYYDQVFHRVSREYRGTMQAKNPGVKNGWIYGERHRMLHDTELLVPR